MNCNDIERILDESNLSQLGTAERAEAAAHRAACPPCAREWEAQERVQAAAVPTLSGTLAAHCRAAFVAAAAPAGGRLRARARGAAFGALLFVGAAAAALVGAQWVGLGGDANETASGSRPEATASPNAVVRTGAPFEPAQSAPATSAQAASDGADAQPPASSAAARTASGFVLAVSPLERERIDSTTVTTVENIYSELVRELRALAGITVVDTPYEPGVESLSMVYGAVSVPPDTVPGGALTRTAIATSGALPEAAFGIARTIQFEAPATGIETRGTFVSANEKEIHLDTNGTIITSESVFTTVQLPPGAVQPPPAPLPPGAAQLPPGILQPLVLVANSGTGYAPSAGVANVDFTIRRDLATAAFPHGAEPTAAELGYDYRLDVATTTVVDPVTGMAKQWVLSVRGSGPDATSTILSVGGDVGDRVDVRESVRHIVESLQRVALPATDLRLDNLRARALDTALSRNARVAALRELKDVSDRTGADARNEQVLRAAIEMAETATDSFERARVWEAVRGSRSDILVPALVNSFLYDADERARLAAAGTLAADFIDRPAARAALEQAAQNDQSPAIRLEANWAVRDAAGRNRYVSDALKDTRLTDEQRLQPLLFALQRYVPFLGPAEGKVELDDGAAAALVNIVRDSEPGRRDTWLGHLERVDHAAVTALYIDTLRSDASEQARHMAVVALSSRLDAPGVRAALGQAERTDPSAAVRAMAAEASKGFSIPVVP